MVLRAVLFSLAQLSTELACCYPKFLQHSDALGLLDVVVRDPQLLQHVPHRLQAGEALDVVPTQRQDLRGNDADCRNLE